VTKGKSCKRSHAPFTDEHLKRLAAKARADQQSLFERKPHLAVYGGPYPRVLDTLNPGMFLGEAR